MSNLETLKSKFFPPKWYKSWKRLLAFIIFFPVTIPLYLILSNISRKVKLIILVGYIGVISYALLSQQSEYYNPYPKPTKSSIKREKKQQEKNSNQKSEAIHKSISPTKFEEKLFNEDLEENDSEKLRRLTHDELAKLKEKVLGKTFIMTLYLEQMPIETDADFMTLPDADAPDNLLIRCYMSPEDLAMLDGESAQKRIYKPYTLEVNFSDFTEAFNFFKANCKLLGWY